MQCPQSSFVLKFVRTCLRVSQQQQQQQQRGYSLLLFAPFQQPLSHDLQTAPKQRLTHFRPAPLPRNSYSRSVLSPRCSFASVVFLAPFALRPYSKFTAAAHSPNPLGHSPLSEERAVDLIANLKDSERSAIKVALEKYDALRLKENYEGKLAATQWRTRFGRLSKVPSLGDVDPTGTFCAFPDDWLKKKAAFLNNVPKRQKSSKQLLMTAALMLLLPFRPVRTEKAKEPSSTDLWKIYIVNAVPFMVFGFLDNFTMIIAGDYIEYAFGYFMCISTMAAAGLGNTISDIIGIGSAVYVERGCEMMGLNPPDLTPVQLQMKSSRRYANWGRIMGITLGCLLGMTPLLFTEHKPPAIAEAPELKDPTEA